MNIDTYLSRIKHEGKVAPDLDTLRALCQAHQLSVPFENLDVHLGRPINLETEALSVKIVLNKRGGFCYELNSLFAWLLREIGFDVTLLSARVYDAEERLGPEFDHMTLLVILENRWLVDVGFGDFLMFPLSLDNEQPQFDSRRAYRVSSNDNLWHVSRMGDSGAWKRDYLFTLQARDLSEYLETCRYHETSPESPFTQRQVCTIATPTGRVTLRGNSTDMKMITTENGSKRERIITDPAEVSAILRDQFGIVI